MATLAEAVTAFAEATGIAPVTMQHTGRCLRDAGLDLVPLSGKGGGKNTRHLEPHHLANMILALAASHPSAAPQAALVLQEFVPERINVERPGPAGLLPLGTFDTADESGERKTLAEWLIQAIDGFARMPEAERRRCEAMTSALQMEIALGMSPPTAALSWTDPSTGQLRVSHRYCHRQPPLLLLAEVVAGPLPRAQVRRLTTVPFSLVFVAAYLWADTLARRGGQLPLPPSGEAPASADPENENAAPARAASRDQDRDGDPRKTTTDIWEAKGERENSQAPSRGSGPSPLDEGAGIYARRTSDPPPAVAA